MKLEERLYWRLVQHAVKNNNSTLEASIHQLLDDSGYEGKLTRKQLRKFVKPDGSLRLSWRFAIEHIDEKRAFSRLRDGFGRRLDEGLGVWIDESATKALKQVISEIKRVGLKDYGIWSVNWTNCRTPEVTTRRYVREVLDKGCEAALD